MKRGTIILLVIVGAILLFAFNGCSSYNSMVTKDEGVTGQWQQVEVAYQARMDKTKNLLRSFRARQISKEELLKK